MAELNVASLAETMIGAARTSLGRKWPTVEAFATSEANKLAMTLVDIASFSAAGLVTPGEASVLLQMQHNTARSVMLALEGMSLLLVEEAINAAMDAVRGTVNTALGFALL